MIEQFKSISKTSLHFGHGLLKNCSSVLPLTKNNRVLIVAGNSTKTTGSLDILKNEVLKLTNTVEQLVGISSDPSVEDVEKVIKSAKAMDADFIMALGGGSVLDAVKAASVLTPEDLDVLTVLRGKASFSKKVSVIAIPTTAGTGAELSKGAIITNDQDGVKSGVRGELVAPEVAIVDPQLTETLSPRQKAITGFDVLTHAIETYISKKATPISELFSLQAIEDISIHLPRVLKNGDMESVEKVALNSALMGYNLGNSSTCLPHRLQYPLGVLSKTEHAYGLSILYPAWLKITAKASAQKFSHVASLMTGQEGDSADILTVMNSFLSEIGLTDSLSDLGLGKKDCDLMSSLVSGSLGNDPWWDETKKVNEIYYEAL